MSRAIVAWRIAGGVIVGLSAVPAPAQDLEAGKPPQALFSANCSACHKSPQGLARGRNVSSFLQTHYTAGSQSAAALAAYLLSVGDPPPAAASRRRGEPAAAARAPEPAARSAESRPARDDRFPDLTIPGHANRQPGPPGSERGGAEAREAGQGRERERPPRGPVRVAGDPAPVTIAVGPLALEQPQQRPRPRSAAAPQTAAPADQRPGQSAAAPARRLPGRRARPQRPLPPG